uniref:Uncharacterized protein n=1 Tax=Mimivirus LCMiAC01 TaxID=2506608 RepID=A0A481Z345_9VIRU|nr:MAG: hypothetical protein LCMiAC01_04880 [Mimivirus LCMiAC01]
MNNKYFQQTGKNIDIGADKLIAHMYAQLRLYDNDINYNKVLEYNPYKDPVIYRTKDNKIVEVPQNIKKIAIKQWILMKQKSQPPISKKILSKPHKKKRNTWINYIWIIIILVITFYVGAKR